MECLAYRRFRIRRQQPDLASIIIDFLDSDDIAFTCLPLEVSLHEHARQEPISGDIAEKAGRKFATSCYESCYYVTVIWQILCMTSRR